MLLVVGMVGGYAYLSYGPAASATLEGIVALLAAAAWMLLAAWVPVLVGIACGAIGLARRSERRATAVVGLTLNGAAAVGLAVLFYAIFR